MEPKWEPPKFLVILYDTEEYSDIVGTRKALKQGILRFDGEDGRVSAKTKNQWYSGQIYVSAG